MYVSIERPGKVDAVAFASRLLYIGGVPSLFTIVRFIFDERFWDPVTNHEVMLYSSVFLTFVLKLLVVSTSHTATCILTDDVHIPSTPVFEAVKECVV